ncbi:MAG: OmpA family protein [Bacteroidales bacterium]
MVWNSPIRMIRYVTYNFLLFFILLGFTVNLTGQNLVINGSFEAHKKCPGRILHQPMKEVNAWSQPTGGSPDYFHQCGKAQSGVPDNKFGHQNAYEGEAYVGAHLYVRDQSFPQYKEYVRGRLSSPLKKGAQYVIWMRVSLADKSQFAVDHIGAFLTPEYIYENTYGMLTYRTRDTVHCRTLVHSRYPKAQLLSKKQKPVKDKTAWTLLADTITAEGGERFILLGNFLPNKYLEPVLVDNDAEYTSAYYYFDDIGVEMIAPPPDRQSTSKDTVSESPLAQDTITTDSTVPGFVFELKNIYFEFDKAYFKAESRDELQALYRFLMRNPDVYIEIQGHTDSLGSRSYNQNLSQRRALSVKRFLEQKGIDSQRLTARGYGKQQPLRSNRTDEGRAFNRRVMIKVLPSKDSEDDL